VGDGNFHSTIIYDPDKKEDYAMIRDFSNKLVDKALSLDGTVTGEHGVGIQKKTYLLKEHPDNIPLMQNLKKTIDPNNIMNPGKMFDIK
jgi:D-lactate dehydrogenase (cytochrome)